MVPSAVTVLTQTPAKSTLSPTGAGIGVLKHRVSEFPALDSSCLSNRQAQWIPGTWLTQFNR